MILEIIKGIFYNPIIYLGVAVLILILSSGKSYLNIIGIISNYIKSFISENNSVIAVIYVIPFLLAISVNLCVIINDEILNNLTVIILILMSLFFTFLTFFDEYKNTKREKSNNFNVNFDRKKYVDETKSVASYEILISIFILILCFVYPMIPEYDLLMCSLQELFSFILYFLFFHLIINLLILLKRYASKQ